MTADPPKPSRRPSPLLRRAVFLGLVAILVVVVAKLVLPKVQFLLATQHSAPVYAPPVLAGRIVVGACTGGFYARDGQRVVLMMSGHCGEPGLVVANDEGTRLGTEGPRAQLADCPAGRFCSPSDFMPMYLEPSQIPWGHLNEVDFTGGGYKSFAAGTNALSCDDIKVGDTVEIGGRNWYRAGKVIQLDRPYAFPTDTIFACMFISDIEAGVGDSGGAVLVNGQPAGITSREISGLLGFTPLAEGLANLNLTLCTDPNCGLTPPAAPSGG